MSDPRVPAPIPTTEQRDLVVQKLTQAFTAGRIELEDFELRTEQAMRAQTQDALDDAMRGLTSKAVVPAAAEQPSGEFSIDHPRRPPERRSFVIMSGMKRTGPWTPAQRHTTIVWMGGAQLDFREARLQPGETHLNCYAMWGGVQIFVPPDMDVEVSGTAIMGGIARVSRAGESTDPRRPRLHIHAVSLMAGIEVKVLKRGEPMDDEDEDDETDTTDEA